MARGAGWPRSCSGGFGPPIERDPARVLEDVRAGRVSPASARADYGVVIAEGENGPSLDIAATEVLRASCRR
jgi:N-methylhydantoinase B